MSTPTSKIVKTSEPFETFSLDTFELHSPSEVSDLATCLFCDQQEFDSGAERSVRLKGCYGRCEN